MNILYLSTQKIKITPMKKIILLVLLFCANRGFAQEDIDYNARFPYKQGLSIISIGTGLPGRDLFF